MNALFLVHNHRNRGSYFRALEIAKRFVNHGYRVHFAFTSEIRLYRPAYDGDSFDHLTLAEMPCFTFFNSHQEGWSLFDAGWRLRDALSRKWDIVYAFSHKPSCLLPALAAKARGARLIMDWADWWGGPEGLYHHSVIPSSPFESLPHTIRFGRRLIFATEASWEGRAYGLADLVTLTSEEFYQHPQAPRDLKSRSLVIHSGAPLEQISPVDKSSARLAHRLPFPKDAVVLGYVANFHLDEPLLMEAFARACRVNKNLYLLVAGAPLDWTTPEQHTATAGRVHHLGWQPFEHMNTVLGCADILLLPLTDVALNRARYPHKISDYMAAGRPVIASDVGETGRLFRRYNLATLAPPTPEGLSAEILNQAVASTSWETQGRHNRDVAEEYFDWDRVCLNLLNCIGRL